jgi:hypothetical protein
MVGIFGYFEIHALRLALVVEIEFHFYLIE